MTQLSRAELSGDPQRIVAVLAQLCPLLLQAEQYQQVIPTFQRYIDLVRDLQLPHLEVVALGNLAVAYRRSGDYIAAANTYEKQLTLARRHNNAHSVLIILGNAGVLYDKLGNLSAASRCFDSALLLAQQLGDMEGAVHALMHQAAVCAQRGQLPQAQQHYQQALEADPSESAKYRCDILLGQAELLWQRARTEPGERPEGLDAGPGCQALAQQALQLAEEQQRPDVAFAAQILLARVVALQDSQSAVDGLSQLARQQQDPARLAAVQYEIFCINRDLLSQKRAIGLYQSLLEKTPDRLFRDRLDALGG